MSRRITCILTTVLICCTYRSPLAALLPTGVDTQRHASALATPYAPSSECKVMWYGDNTYYGFYDEAEIARLRSLGYPVTVVAGTDSLAPAVLAQFQILVLAHTGRGRIAQAQQGISDFVAGGGGLLIHQPNHLEPGHGPIDYAPSGFEVTVTHSFWCGLDVPSNDFVSTIVNASHPITAGLADADLSGDFDTVEQFGAGYALLTRSANCPVSAIALGAGVFGAGRVVFEDGNAAVTSALPGSDTYWSNILSWLCPGGVVPAHSRTWGGLKSIYR